MKSWLHDYDIKMYSIHNQRKQDLNGEEILGTYFERELQKKKQSKFRVEKVIKRKGDNLYANWKGYDNLFNRPKIRGINESIFS